MKIRTMGGVVFAALLSLGVAALMAQSGAKAPQPAATKAPQAAATKPAATKPAATAQPDFAAQDAVLQKYCVACHNEKTKAGSLSLVGDRKSTRLNSSH